MAYYSFPNAFPCTIFFTAILTTAPWILHRCSSHLTDEKDFKGGKKTCRKASIDLKKNAWTACVAFTVRVLVYMAVKIELQAFAKLGRVSISEEEMVFLKIHSRDKVAYLSSYFRAWVGQWDGLSWSGFNPAQAQHLKPCQLSPPPPRGLQPNIRALNIHCQQSPFSKGERASSYPSSLELTPVMVGWGTEAWGELIRLECERLGKKRECSAEKARAPWV